MWKKLRISPFPALHVEEGYASEVSQNRLFVVIGVFALVFLTIALRLLEVNINKDDATGNARSRTNNDALAFKRLDIIDRNGVLLAVNLATASLYATPKTIQNPKEVADKVYGVLPDLNYKHLLAGLSSGKSFVWVKRNITPKEEYAVNSLGIPSLQFERGEKRLYPHGTLVSHVLGYVGLDGKGLAGIEKQFGSYLSLADNEASAHSGPLQLSIDVRVQTIVHEEMEKAFEEFKPLGGVGIVLDVTNGEMLAMTSLPDFDPQAPGEATSEQLFNRATLGVYEMGSSFKTFTMAMALDTNTVTLSSRFDVNSPIKAARFSIGDYHAKGGTMSVPEIFMYSSNIGTAKIGIEVGGEKQRYFLKKFGLLDPLAIELPEKSPPMYPPESRWGEISTMTISYGHGIAVTPVHVARAMAGLVNGGMLYPTTLIKHKEGERPEGTRIISEDTSDKIRRLLHLVVTQGTGKKGAVPGYLVGGKTGTSEKLSNNGNYSRHANLSSFVAAFPINKPRYVVVVILDEPKGNKSTGGYSTGGMTAAPVVAKIISRMGPLYGMQPVDEQSEAIRKAVEISTSGTTSGDKKLASY